MKVAFLLCNDVLIEVFSFIDRRHLAKLERSCRRFHAIVDQYFSGRPFLILELECHARQDPNRFNKVLDSEDIEDGHEIGSRREVIVCFIRERPEIMNTLYLTFLEPPPPPS